MAERTTKYLRAVDIQVISGVRLRGRLSVEVTIQTLFGIGFDADRPDYRAPIF